MYNDQHYTFIWIFNKCKRNQIYSADILYNECKGHKMYLNMKLIKKVDYFWFFLNTDQPFDRPPHYPMYPQHMFSCKIESILWSWKSEEVWAFYYKPFISYKEKTTGVRGGTPPHPTIIIGLREKEFKLGEKREK